MRVNGYLAVLSAAFALANGSANFFALTQLRTYKNAVGACFRRGGTIASFQSDDEFNEAATICQDACNAYDSGNTQCGCWTGMRDDVGENTWYNEDGAPADYGINADGSAKTGQYPWYAGEPNNYATTNKGEDCTHIWKPQSYKLNDIKCSSEYLAVCRIEPASEFFALKASQSQSAAEAQCKDENGVIASFHNAYDFEKASQLCESTCNEMASTNSDCGCWTGLKDSSVENVWYNEDGTAADYMLNSDGSPKTGVNPWWSGEPNDWGNGEDCVHIWKPQSFYLNDIACSDNNYAICKRVPKPRDSRYFAIGTKMTQVNAANACENRNGKIASFHSDTDYETASALCEATCDEKEPTNTGCGCWTGLRDDVAEDVWYNEDGSAKDYGMSALGAPKTGQYPWHSGEPNDWGSGEDCVHIWKAQGYDLNDLSCSGSYFAICQKDAGYKMNVANSAPVFDFFDNFDNNMRYQTYWLMALVAISVALFISCTGLMYVNFCKGRGGQKYSKVVMMGSDTDVDVEM